MIDARRGLSFYWLQHELLIFELSVSYETVTIIIRRNVSSVSYYWVGV